MSTGAPALHGVDARTVTRPLDALLRQVAERFPLLACCTPVDAAAEQTRLVDAWARGDERSPRWEAPTIDRESLGALQHALSRAESTLAIARDPWLVAYHARIVECAQELAVVDAAFGQAIGDRARARYARDDRDDEADRLATTLATRTLDDEGERIVTDDERDPRSLVSQMRRGIAARSLGVRVMVRERIGALAAAGDGIVIVAKSRRISEAEATRVVLHELEGHVLPRERGRAGDHGLATLGSAGASEDEEGRAILIEERAGLLDGRRARGLAARHLAARLVDSGATYVEVARHLRDACGSSLDDALAIASRVMRGGHRRGADVVGGVARERVYLPAYLRIGDAMRSDPSILERLGRARLSLATRRALDL